MNSGLDNIIVIGCGGIGQHHCSSLLKAGNLNLYCIDINQKNLEKLKEKVSSNERVGRGEVFFLDSLEEVRGKSFLLAVIATPSKVRLSMLEELISTTSIENVLLEKLVAPSAFDLNGYEEVLEKYQDINFFVNCPRRVYPFYQELKKEIENAETLNLNVEGGDWNLGSNGIHFIDLYSYFVGDSFLSFSKIEGMIQENKKHIGYSEFIGEITLISPKGRLNLSSQRKQKPLSVSIFTEEQTIFVLEGEGEILRVGETKIFPIELPYQSELTQEYLECIRSDCDIGLISLKASIDLHRVLFEAFLQINGQFAFT